MNSCDEERLFKELLFYKVSIEKTKIKHLLNIDLLHEFTFYDELILTNLFKKFYIE